MTNLETDNKRKHIGVNRQIDVRGVGHRGRRDGRKTDVDKAVTEESAREKWLAGRTLWPTHEGNKSSTYSAVQFR